MMRSRDRDQGRRRMVADRLRWLADRIRDLPLVISLWIADLLAGPMPKTMADDIREAERERLRRALSGAEKASVGRGGGAFLRLPERA